MSEHAYRYGAGSRLDVDGSDVRLVLATSGGVDRTGPAVAPRFFSGFLGHPVQSAACLLAVARVARTRFYTPPNVTAAIIRAADPVVTSNGDRLRFESFSACCGVHARFDALPGTLDGPAIGVGTTNVDFNPPMREALGRVQGLDPIHLDVGTDDVTVTTLDGTVVEDKVPLPDRWLKGFAEVEVATAEMLPVLDVGATEARRFLAGIARSPSFGSTHVVEMGGRLRRTTRSGPSAVPLPGPQRLGPFEPLLQHARGLRAYAAPGSDASTWELVLDDARLVLTVSPDVRRGFSGEGGILTDLADDSAAVDAELLAELLGWEPRIEVDDLAARTGIDRDRVRRALRHLGAAGRVGFDVSEGAHFHRELPFAPDALAKMHPRLRGAQRIVDAGGVELHPNGSAHVTSAATIYAVRRVDGDWRCTCRWWGKFQSSRGPCKHVLAVEEVMRRG